MLIMIMMKIISVFAKFSADQARKEIKIQKLISNTHNGLNLLA